MNKIKFSHKYEKLPENIKTAMLMAVININLENQTHSFLIYDTGYIKDLVYDLGKIENGTVGFYPLPEKGKYMILCFLADTGAFFTTIRRFTPEKEKYYKSEIGKIFEVVVK